PAAWHTTDKVVVTRFPVDLPNEFGKCALTRSQPKPSQLLHESIDFFISLSRRLFLKGHKGFIICDTPISESDFCQIFLIQADDRRKKNRSKRNILARIIDDFQHIQHYFHFYRIKIPRR